MKTLNNNINLIGNLGQDVKMITFESGTKKAEISLATTDYNMNQAGEWVANTLWHRVIAWGKNAEAIARTCAKGSRIALEGTINYRSYTDSEGKNKTITEILLHDFMKVSN
jgi:single-strand DNA-binding protein